MVFAGSRGQPGVGGLAFAVMQAYGRTMAGWVIVLSYVLLVGSCVAETRGQVGDEDVSECRPCGGAAGYNVCQWVVLSEGGEPMLAWLGMATAGWQWCNAELHPAIARVATPVSVHGLHHVQYGLPWKRWIVPTECPSGLATCTGVNMCTRQDVAPRYM